jgi:hypothetical protein
MDALQWLCLLFVVVIIFSAAFEWGFSRGSEQMRKLCERAADQLAEESKEGGR